ncbi:serine hydrolase [Benzoatithermus flavus]|uniref:Serine hydrolase n=1 Tax=Benzoatithermus flavus TaxID=3108223 RepID=A0ABU8XM39_9PROT
MRWGERAWFVLLWLALLVSALASPASARQEAYILLDHASGEVLDARNADEPAYPASLTKMMTLYLTFRALESGQITLDSRFRVSPRAAAMAPTKLGLKPNSTIRVEDAILGLVTKSANDAAATLAEGLGGSEDQFALLMTRTARELGMTRTVFRNASGLPNPEQRTTARDLARLATRLINDFPQYYGYFSRRSFSYGGRVHGNHNRLLFSYAGMDGLKTGYTQASGFNLAASAVRGGRRLVAVVLGGPTARARDVEMAQLLDAGFEKLDRERRSGPVEVARAQPSPERPMLAAAAYGSDEAAGDAGDVVAASLTPPAKRSAATRKQEEIAAELEPARPGKKAAKIGAARNVARKRAASPYGIQVGAYQKAPQAREAAQRAMQRAPELLRSTFVSVSSQKMRRKTVFRATLVGLTEEDARAACRRLKKSKQDCLVVRTGPVAVAER